LEIHERIRKIRESKGLQQKQMATLLKMPANTYNGYETGKRKIDAYLLREISIILNCPVSYLLEIEESTTWEGEEASLYKSLSPEDKSEAKRHMKYLKTVRQLEKSNKESSATSQKIG